MSSGNSAGNLRENFIDIWKICSKKGLWKSALALDNNNNKAWKSEIHLSFTLWAYQPMQVVRILFLPAWKECRQGAYILGECYSMNHQQKGFENRVYAIEGALYCEASLKWKFPNICR